MNMWLNGWENGSDRRFSSSTSEKDILPMFLPDAPGRWSQVMRPQFIANAEGCWYVPLLIAHVGAWMLAIKSTMRLGRCGLHRLHLYMSQSISQVHHRCHHDWSASSKVPFECRLLPSLLTPWFDECTALSSYPPSGWDGLIVCPYMFSYGRFVCEAFVGMLLFPYFYTYLSWVTCDVIIRCSINISSSDIRQWVPQVDQSIWRTPRPTRTVWAHWRGPTHFLIPGITYGQDQPKGESQVYCT